MEQDHTFATLIKPVRTFSITLHRSLILLGNAGIISQNLTVTNNVPGSNGLSQAKEQDFNITVALPSDLACVGASTGNVCTVRCRNNAVAGPFGGCFAIQQTDITPTVNSAETISTAQTLDGINKQIAQNQIDLPAAIQANQNAGSTSAEQGLAAVNALLGITVTSSAAPTQTPDAAVAGTATAASSASTTKASKTKTSSAAASTKTSSKKNNNKRGLRFGKRIVVDEKFNEDSD